MTKVTQAHLDARREEILAAAVKVFARKGMQSATMAEIADEAGISAGAIYRYFANKEELAAYCMRESGEQVATNWGELREDNDDPLRLFESISRKSFDEINLPEAPNETYLMIESQLAAARSGDSLQPNESRRTHDIIVAGLADAIGKMQAAGQFPADLDAVQLGSALLSFYWGARLTRLVHEDAVDTDAQLMQVWKVLMLAASANREPAAAKQ
jgi:AcrR family transcriptional regulator